MKVLNTLKRVICILLVIVMTMSLSACGETLTSFAGAAISNVEARFKDNRAVLKTLHDSGVISDEVFEEINTTMTATEDTFGYLNSYMDLNPKPEEVIKVLKGERVETESGDKIDLGINLLAAISGVVPVAQPYSSSVFTKFDGMKEGDVFDKKYKLEGEEKELELKYLAFSNFILSGDNWNMSKGCVYDVIGRWLFPESVTTADNIPDKIAGVPALYSDVGSDGKQGMFYTFAVKRNCNPIKIISDDNKEDIIDGVKDLLSQPIYVLRPDLACSSGTDATSLNKLAEAQKAIKSGKEEELKNYFYQPESDSGKPLTLQVILEQAIEKNPEELKDLIAIKDHIAENIVTETTWNINDETKNGKDIILHQFDKPSASFRIVEFNYRVCSLVNEATGIFNSGDDEGTKYKLINNHVYMLEYPVEAICNFEAKRLSTSQGFGADNTQDNVVVNVNLTNSGMGINIMNGRIIKYHVNSSNAYTEAGEYINDKDFYLNSALYDNTGNSSFALIGYTTLKVGSPISEIKVWESGTWEHPDNESTISLGDTYNTYVPRIVLTDYLEATFAPGWNPSGDGDVAIFGRKIRFSTKMTHVVDGSKSITIKVDGSKKTVKQKVLQYDRINYIATYCDKNGALNESHLQISDFCDLALLVDKELQDKEVKTITPFGAEDTTIEARSQDEWESDQPDTQDLKFVLGSTDGWTIMPTRMFPGPKLGNDDFKSDKSAGINDPHFTQTQRFWTVAVKKGIFDSGLFVTWIDSSTPEASLEWWNTYLEEHHFLYRVDKDEVQNYLLDSYITQMQRAGIVIIDPNAIKDLQDMYGKEADMQRSATIKTTFAVIGWGLIAFSLILLLIWALDTNTDLGLNLLNKVTFGHWIAVKYKTDIPEGDAENVTYMSGDKVMIRCLIIIAVGILLITINALDIVSMLVEAFGKVASELERIIRGS